MPAPDAKWLLALCASLFEKTSGSSDKARIETLNSPTYSGLAKTSCAERSQAVVDLGDRRAVVVGEYDHVFHRAHDGVPCEPDGAALVFGQRQCGRCEYAALVHPERTYDARRVFRPERNFGAALPLGRIAGAYQLYGLFAASVVGAYDRTPAVVRGRGLPRVVGIERQGRFAACDSYGKAFALETVDFDVGFAGLLGDGEFLAERTFAVVADDDQPRRFGRGIPS